MDLRFVITLSEHRLLGYIFAPYLVKMDIAQGNHVIHDRVTLLNLKLYESALSPEETQLARIIEEYNDQSLFKVFSKKKNSSAREFVKSMPQELLRDQIRPYVERRMDKCIDLLMSNPIPIYHKVLQNNIYEDDRIEVVEEDGLAVFNFIRSAEGIKYFLTIEHNGKELRLKGKNAIVAMNEPCCLILEEKLFIFRDIDGKKLMPFFTKDYIDVPKSAEAKFLETFVRNAIRKFKVKAEGFSVEDYLVKPSPALSIEKDFHGRYNYVLKFIYDEKSIYYANRRTEIKVTSVIKGNNIRFVRMQRDYAFENECITSLLAIGLVNREGPFFRPLQKMNDEDGPGYYAINWINQNHELLASAGFSIAQNNIDRVFYLDDIEIKIQVSEKNNDWFDIDAHVEFAGFKIPFASFTKNILDGEREYMLPDGRIVILPGEWFANYRDLLSFAKVQNDSIRLEKKHFPLLNREMLVDSATYKQNLLSLIEGKCEPEKIPEGIKANLRNYQTEGYSWLFRLYKNGFGGCLADDMGLGKTLQTLTLLRRIQEESPEEGVAGKTQNTTVDFQLSIFDNQPSSGKSSLRTALIVVPTSLVHNWMNEASRFVAGLKMHAYTGPQRSNLAELFQQYDIIITSYGILRNDIDKFLAFDFFYLILDESQMIKNSGSKTYQTVIQLKARHRIVLTGTPIENSLTDLWAQINFLNPGLLGNLNFFHTEFKVPIEKMGDEKKRERLNKLITPFILRRSKGQVEPELPPVSEQLIFCDLDEEQEAYYEREKSKARNLVIEKLSQIGFGKSAVVILQTLTKLRQIANHPALIDENYFAGSGKYDEITRNLQSLLEEHHKALVFSSFVKHLELVAAYLDKNQIRYAWLTGETRNREDEIRKFQEDETCPFFLISLKAGGVGLNLTAADYVLILDPWWNPAAEMQAISRAHRIGQDKHVLVYRFISRNTLEEKILKLQERKSELADAFINNSLKGITQEQVMELFE
jgi:superfamily II DNA or RNA helicase